jgi:nicotinate-nucleotide--dimethylbenzimidazole phosphoribosyltransferase
MDGFISAVAALIACKLNKNVRDYIIESHISAEQGYAELAKMMDLQPAFAMGMRLGEGSGCPLALWRSIWHVP